MEEYKKYLAVVRGMVHAKWILRQTDNGLELKNDTNYSLDIADGWKFWCSYSDFKRDWIDEGMNPDNDDEYEDDLFIESFDDLDEAIEWLNNNYTHIPPPNYDFSFYN